MSPDTDPYRTLGLSRDASLEEVKRAYRRLAKANHPDAAGEASLTRFLEIQAAYDRIVGPGTGTDGRPGGRRSGPPRQPWEADPTRANATHRAYGGRGRRSRPAGSGSGTRAAPGSRPEPGPPPGPRRPPRPPNKATLGSTSYDGAEAEPFEPDWVGASWYGTTSGTYWTLNPKEYADPRKHGPEYQARARRAAEAAASGGAERDAGAAGAAAERAAAAEATADTASASFADDAAPVDAAAGTADPAASPPPTHTTASWWEATAGPAGPESGAPVEASGEDVVSASADGTAPWAWAFLEADRPGPLVRVARAVLGWAPLALGIGWGAGELTGCGRFAAECDPSASGLVWLAQVALLLALLALPRLASVAAVAGVAAVVAAIPGALLLTASGGGDTDGADAAVLGGLLAIAWIGGAAVGALRAMRRIPRPVS